MLNIKSIKYITSKITDILKGREINTFILQIPNHELLINYFNYKKTFEYYSKPV